MKTLGAFDLEGRTAIVTGASRGLGRQFACALARAGADLVADRAATPKTLKPFTKPRSSRWDGAPCRSRSTYATRPASRRSPKLRWRETGRIDILVNNAGCNVRKPAIEVTWDDWNLILDTNLRGAFFVAQAIARRSMIPHEYGRIINIGSVTSVNGYAGLGPYGASRGGIKQLTMSLADDWGVARHHRQLPGARLVPHRAEQGDVRGPRVGRVPRATAFR